jgi:hypothetical protein
MTAVTAAKRSHLFERVRAQQLHPSTRGACESRVEEGGGGGGRRVLHHRRAVRLRHLRQPSVATYLRAATTHAGLAPELTHPPTH